MLKMISSEFRRLRQNGIVAICNVVTVIYEQHCAFFVIIIRLVNYYRSFCMRFYYRPNIVQHYQTIDCLV